jgi:hypothetical protein
VDEIWVVALCTHRHHTYHSLKADKIRRVTREELAYMLDVWEVSNARRPLHRSLRRKGG